MEVLEYIVFLQCLGPRRIRIVSDNASDKVILPRLFKYGAISKSHPCKADVLDVQLQQSTFMTSTENVNKLCLFVQETEHLQVKLTMMVCPERAYEMFTTSQTSVHSDTAFKKHELAGCRKNINIQLPS